MGGDSWGTYKDWDVAKIGTMYPYRALRITPKVVNINSKVVKKFNIAYLKQYKESPDAISYVTYNTLQSITDAMLGYNCHYIKIDDNILCSYKLAILKNVQWYRPIIHEVYEMTKHKDVFITDIE